MLEVTLVILNLMLEKKVLMPVVPQVGTTCMLTLHGLSKEKTKSKVLDVMWTDSRPEELLVAVWIDHPIDTNNIVEGWKHALRVY